MKDKDLQKKIKKEFGTPDVPFEEWAQKRGVFTDGNEEYSLQLPVPETADNVNGNGTANGGRRKSLILGVSAGTVVLAVAAIILGFSLRPVAPVVYGANDTISVEATLEEVIEKQDCYLFDMSGVVSTEMITKDVLKNDNTQVMLYTITNSLLSVENGQNYDGFYLTYYVKVYHNYEFISERYFDNPANSSTVNNFTVNYKIDGSKETVAYASFSAGSYEYFIEARGYEGVTVVTEDNFINLLNKILI